MKYFFTFVMLAAIALPQSTSAYFTTNQFDVGIGDGAGVMYGIEYRFGLTKSDLMMPIATVRDLATGADEFAVGYEILDTSRVVSDAGESVGIVLSDAEIRDGHYFVPAGEVRTFTLLTVLAAENTTDNGRYRMHVTHLPFTNLTNGGEHHLNIHELSHYETKSEELEI